MYIHTCVYIYIERERYVYVCIYIFLYIYIYTITNVHNTNIHTNNSSGPVARTTLHADIINVGEARVSASGDVKTWLE